MATRQRIKPPKVHIVFDTNALFTEAADKLLAAELSAYILEVSPAVGMDISWHIPSIVRKERHNQMLDRGVNLLNGIAKLELLLGHKLGIDPLTLDTRVDEAIRKQMILHKINEIFLETSGVDWDNIINCAAFKKPPFDKVKEKGFKDAIVLETFVQFCKKMPSSKSSCRVALLTDDGLLKEAARSRISGMSNVAIISSIEELRSFVNALASHLPDGEVDRLLELAKPLFWIKDDQQTLWFKAKIGEAVSQHVKEVKPPHPDCRITVGTFMLVNIGFVSKSGQRVRFMQRVEAAITAVRNRNLHGMPPIGGLLGLSAESKWDELNSLLVEKSTGRPALAPLGSRLGSVVSDFEEKFSGKYTVDVIWEATLTRRGTLNAASLIETKYGGVNWAENSEGTFSVT